MRFEIKNCNKSRTFSSCFRSSRPVAFSYRILPVASSIVYIVYNKERYLFDKKNSIIQLIVFIQVLSEECELFKRDTNQIYSTVPYFIIFSLSFFISHFVIVVTLPTFTCSKSTNGNTRAMREEICSKLPIMIQE